MWLSDLYEIPQELIDNPPSPEFQRFLVNWFGSNRVDGDVKFRSATCLAPDELTLARELMRRNLKTRRIGIIHGTWILADPDAIPILREMFGNEPDESRRLTIASALWKLCKDQAFIECLNRTRGTSLMVPHMSQVLWLDDERAIDFLIDLLPTEEDESRVRFFGVSRDRNEEGQWALSWLNNLEQGRLVILREWHPPSYYRDRRNGSLDFAN